MVIKMSMRMDTWTQKFNELADMVGRERAIAVNDSITDEMLGIRDDYEGEIPTTEEAINSLSDENFEKLIEYLDEEMGIQKDIESDREWRAAEERLKIEITMRETELCFDYDLSKRQAQIVARREHDVSTEDIMKEFGISKQAISDAYTKGIQKLALMQSQMQGR